MSIKLRLNDRIIIKIPSSTETFPSRVSNKDGKAGTNHNPVFGSVILFFFFTHLTPSLDNCNIEVQCCQFLQIFLFFKYVKLETCQLQIQAISLTI